MKWVIVTGLLATLLRHGGGSAIRCTPEKDASCSTGIAKEVPSPPVVLSQPADPPSPQVECEAGSEWESNCHYCRCSDTGVAECLRQETCGDGVFEEPLQCKPNSTFVRDCNTCICLENGLALCTLEFCRRSSITKKSELPAGKDCAPGTTWTNKCGECRCSDAGYRQCNAAECKGKDHDMRCAPNSMWKNDCNTCWCTSDGRAVCTKIGCVTFTNFNFDKVKNANNDDKQFSEMVKNDINGKDDKYVTKNFLHNLVKRSVCKPNQEFQSECNNCKCSPNGQQYTCTQNECLEKDMNKEVEVFMESEGVDHIERHSVCKPRDTFYIGCNTCNCNYDGTDYSCTNKPCPLPEDVELFHELREMKPIIPYEVDNENRNKKSRL